MSVYASLPGSIPPPFHAFRASTMDGKAGSGSGPKSGEVDRTLAKQKAVGPKDTLTSPSSYIADSFAVIGPSAYKVLSLLTDSDGSKGAPPFSSRPCDIIVAIRSARVDAAQLVKSLTLTGSGICRRSTNLFARAEEVSESRIPDTVEEGSGDEDTSLDEEYYSMYDYSDDFSPTHANGADVDLELEDDQFDYHSEEELSAIVFELSIISQGTRYNTSRALSTFVKLRSDLISELHDGDACKRKHDFRSHRINRIGRCSTMDATAGRGVASRVPELPMLSSENLGCGVSPGFARGGFGMLWSTAQHCCTEMERWTRLVIETFPCSQSLASFLWEPLSSRSSSWDTVDARREISEIGCASQHNERTSLQHRCKPRWNNFSRNAKFVMRGSVGSLNSIEEGDCNDCNDHTG